MENNFDIKLKDHYKLDVLLKDKIIFESELNKQGIKYYTQPREQTSVDQEIRYFLLDTDMKAIDQIIIQHEIVASTESHLISDFSDQKKISKLYWGVLLTVVSLIILAALLEKMF